MTVRLLFLVLLGSLTVSLQPDAGVQQSATSVSYPAKPGPGQGKHVVFLSGDEEYRGEEGLPMLAKILSQRHGFKCTVLFSVDPDGTINPKASKSLSDPAALDTADAIVMLLRFRAWPDEEMARFEKFLLAGKPIVALRTSTHAFNGLANGGPWDSWNYNNQGGFGKRVLGETWLTHWGKHKVEATRGAIEPGARGPPDPARRLRISSAIPTCTKPIRRRTRRSSSAVSFYRRSLRTRRRPTTARRARPTSNSKASTTRRCPSCGRASTKTATARRTRS